jgi:hypothetical protein
MSLWTVHGRDNGTFDFKVAPFPRGVINRHRHVLANICEVAHIEGDRDELPWVGLASMEIHQIIPQDTDSVVLRIEIDWNEPLNFRIQLFVFD